MRSLLRCTGLCEAQVLSYGTVVEASDHPVDKVLSLLQSLALADRIVGRKNQLQQCKETHIVDEFLGPLSG